MNIVRDRLFQPAGEVETALLEPALRTYWRSLIYKFQELWDHLEHEYCDYKLKISFVFTVLYYSGRLDFGRYTTNYYAFNEDDIGKMIDFYCFCLNLWRLAHSFTLHLKSYLEPKLFLPQLRTSPFKTKQTKSRPTKRFCSIKSGSA